MKNFLKKLFINLPSFLIYPIYLLQKKNQNIILDFLYDNSPNKNNLTLREKKSLINKLLLSFKHVKSATSFESNLAILRYGLKNIDPTSNGCIVECGCFKGASSITLSILAKITNKKLYIYDSFEGLPQIKNDLEKKAYYPHLTKYSEYHEGMYKGTYKEVSENIDKFGYIENCLLIKGYFSDTLKKHDQPIDFIFVDVDLQSSLLTCIESLWGNLAKNSYLFTDDSCDINLVKIWFDDAWWHNKFNQSAPGYIGSGCGIPLKGDYSSLGYTIKNDKDNYKLINWS